MRKFWTDEEILHALDLRASGLGATLIARKMSRETRERITKGQIIGILNRVDKDDQKHPCACVKPENKTGGMPEKWWAR